MGQIVRPTGSDIFTRFERKEKLQSKPQTGAGATSSENGLFLFYKYEMHDPPSDYF